MASMRNRVQTFGSRRPIGCQLIFMNRRDPLLQYYENEVTPSPSHEGWQANTESTIIFIFKLNGETTVKQMNAGEMTIHTESIYVIVIFGQNENRNAMKA